MRWAYVVATLLAAALSVPVARRREQYRPVSAFLVVMFLADHLRTQLIWRLIKPAKKALESRGLDPCVAHLPNAPVWAGHVEHALYLAFPTGIAALSVWMFLRPIPQQKLDGPHPYRSPQVTSESDWATVLAGVLVGLIGLGWMGEVATMILGYQHLRCDALKAVYVPAVVGSLLTSFGCIAQWWWRRRSPEIEHASVALLFALEILAAVTLVGRLEALWPLAQIARIVCHTLVIVIQALALVRGGRTWLGGGSRAD